MLLTHHCATDIYCLHTVKWLNSSIWPIDRTKTDTTTPGQSGSGSNDNVGVLYILLSSRTRTSPTGHSAYLSAEMQSAYSTTPVNWANKHGKATSRSRQVILIVCLAGFFAAKVLTEKCNFYHKTEKRGDTKNVPQGRKDWLNEIFIVYLGYFIDFDCITVVFKV